MQAARISNRKYAMIIISMRIYCNAFILQHLSSYLVVHLDPTISCLSLVFPVTVEPVTSVNVKSTTRQAIAITEELLACSAKVKFNHCSMKI